MAKASGRNLPSRGDGEIRVLDSAPNTAVLMGKAALPVLPVPGLSKNSRTLPDFSLARHGLRIDPAHVAAYARVCGFPRKETLPIPYLHMLAFSMHLAMMTDAEFPYPAMGTVHLENTITSYRPTTAADTYDLMVSASGMRAHDKGTVFDLVTQARVADELVWEETSTMLRRGAKNPAGVGAQPLDLTPVEGNGVEWRLPSGLGRSYASVSGDRNPIHLYPWTAKAFGFPRHIVHGMWSKARCIAAVENRLPDAVRIEASFKTPIFLPSTVRFSAEKAEEQRFTLANPKNGAPHVVGRATEL